MFKIANFVLIPLLFLLFQSETQVFAQGKVEAEVKTLTPDGEDFTTRDEIKIGGTALVTNNSMKKVGARLHIRVLDENGDDVPFKATAGNPDGTPGDWGVPSAEVKAGEEKSLSIRNYILGTNEIGGYTVVGQVYVYDIDANDNWSNPRKLGDKKETEFYISEHPGDDDKDPPVIPVKPEWLERRIPGF